MDTTLFSRIMFYIFWTSLSALAGVGMQVIAVQQGWLRAMCVQETPIYLDSVEHTPALPNPKTKG